MTATTICDDGADAASATVGLNRSDARGEGTSSPFRGDRS